MKKLFSLLLVVAMFASMSIVGFAATGANDVSVEIVETADGIVATYYITNPSNVTGFTASLVFPSTLTTDKSYTLATDFAKCTVAPSSKSGQVRFQASFTAEADYVTKSGKVAMISFPLTRTDDNAVYASSNFSFGTGLYLAKVGAIVDGTLTQLDPAATAAKFTAPVYVDNRVAEKFINDEGANGGVGTITFYGRVGADWLDQDYGVIVDGKDFYGAKDGDIVSDGAEGTKTFNFDAWDGNFEIILNNITVKGTAGTKTYQFFVGENVTEAATVVVE